METLYSACWYLDASKSTKTSFVSSARKRPRMRLSCLMKTSRSLAWPKGLYFRLNRSKRWKVPLSACMSSASTLSECAVSRRLSKTSARVRYLPSRKMTTSSGSLRSFDFMNRRRCFWCMHAEWCTCVSTFRTL